MQRNYPDAIGLPLVVDAIDDDAVLIESALVLLEELDSKLPKKQNDARFIARKIHNLLSHWKSSHDCLMGDLIYQIDWSDTHDTEK